jgi:hypothetical protein
MSEDLTTVIVDAFTGESSERYLNQDELAERKTILDEIKKQEQDLALKIEARTSALAKLAALGLTEEEIAAL